MTLSILSSTITILKSVILICLLALPAIPVSADYNDRSQETFVLVHGAQASVDSRLLTATLSLLKACVMFS
ncbi:MAG: hypothetical protein ACI9BG_000956, partial [Parasphingorhabdus sp.]